MVFSGLDPSVQALATQLLTMQRTGAILLGSWFSTALLGLCLYQTATYYARFRHDRPIFKLLVAVIMVINTTHTIVLCQWQVDTLVYSFGDVMNLTSWDFLVTSEWALISSAAALAQLFYAWRVYVLLGKQWASRIMFGAIVAISLAGFATGWTLAIKQSQLGNAFPVSPLDAIRWLFILAFALPCAADILIMCGMLFGLGRVRKLSLPSSTHRAIQHILSSTVECNVLTTGLTLAVIIAFALNWRPIAICIGAMVPKVYQLTLVNSLLSRSSHHGRPAAATGFLASDPSETTGASPRTVGARSGVFVHTVRQVQVDDEYGMQEVKLPMSKSDSADLSVFVEQKPHVIEDAFATPPTHSLEHISAV